MANAINLFSPIKIGDIQLKNRMVMAPMTRSRALPGGVPNPLAVEYYKQRASAGLIITEGAQVSPQGVGYIFTPGIHSQSQVEGWKPITDAVHAAGGRIFLQLWHVGRTSHPDFHNGELPIAPSAIGFDGEAYTPQGRKKIPTPRALRTEEIPPIVEQFHVGAANAKAAGFDGVEVHGANGYLPDQFLQDCTNRRNDEYGGSVENRARFLLSVTKAALDVWGNERVGVRLSPAGTFGGMGDSQPTKTFGYAIQALDKLPLAYLHLMEAFGGAAHKPDYEGTVLDYFGKLFSGPVIINGGFDRELGNSVVSLGKASMVSFGALYLANPDLPERFRVGAKLNAPDRNTFYGGDAKGYTDYPALSGL